MVSVLMCIQRNRLLPRHFSFLAIKHLLGSLEHLQLEHMHELPGDLVKIEIPIQGRLGEGLRFCISIRLPYADAVGSWKHSEWQCTGITRKGR